MQNVQHRFSKKILFCLILLSLSLFPLVFLTCTPVIWLAAIAFPYIEALAVCAAGTFIGMLLPFLVSRHLFRKRFQTWLPHFPRVTALLSAAATAGTGGQESGVPAGGGVKCWTVA